MTSVEGGCHCGAIRYKITETIEHGDHCHCSICRKLSGALFASWVSVEQSSFSYTKGTPSSYKSSKVGKRAFCPSCGSQLTMQFASEAPENSSVYVSAGTLDDPSLAKFDFHGWTINASKHFEIKDEVTRYPFETTPPGFDEYMQMLFPKGI